MMTLEQAYQELANLVANTDLSAEVKQQKIFDIAKELFY
jgi:hypothetical protein